MKLRRSRRSKRGRIEIIPMIDVMFFLLATFMLTSLAMQRLDRSEEHSLNSSHTEIYTLSLHDALPISRRSKRGRIEIIPMIDVMFFLLATFMLTSLAMQRLD